MKQFIVVWALLISIAFSQESGTYFKSVYKIPAGKNYGVIHKGYHPIGWQWGGIVETETKLWLDISCRFDMNLDSGEIDLYGVMFQRGYFQFEGIIVGWSSKQSSYYLRYCGDIPADNNGEIAYLPQAGTKAVITLVIETFRGYHSITVNGDKLHPIRINHGHNVLPYECRWYLPVLYGIPRKSDLFIMVYGNTHFQWE